MSRTFMFTLLATLAGSGVALAHPIAPVQVNVEAQLAPYGQWRDDAQHGHVFCPSDSQYTPYTQGRWEMQGAERVWVPATQIGQLTENYGQWVQTNTGWAWVPGTSYTAGPSDGWYTLNGGGGGGGRDYDNRWNDDGRRQEWRRMQRERVRAEWEQLRMERERMERERQMMEERAARERFWRHRRWEARRPYPAYYRYRPY